MKNNNMDQIFNFASHEVNLNIKDTDMEFQKHMKKCYDTFYNVKIFKKKPKTTIITAITTKTPICDLFLLNKFLFIKTLF